MTIILKNVKVAINITATASVAFVAIAAAAVYYGGWAI
jgi:hypothetical protein